jgi:hypothetical protein
MEIRQVQKNAATVRKLTGALLLVEVILLLGVIAKDYTKLPHLGLALMIASVIGLMISALDYLKQKESAMVHLCQTSGLMVLTIAYILK